MNTLERSSVPRYIQLATLFRRRIEDGQWPMGTRISTVDELAEECSVARATIRQALGLLEDEGLIERLRAKGTFVRKVPAEQIWVEIETNFASMLRAREGAEIEVLADQPDQRPPPVIPHKVGELANAYRRLRRRHWRHGQPYFIGEVFIDERLVPEIPPEAFTTKTSLTLVADVPGLTIVDMHQTLAIGAADLETAEILRIPLNSPIAYVDRSAVDSDGYLVLISKGIYRGDMVRLELKLR